MMLHCLFLLFSTMVGESFQDGITEMSNAVQALEGSSATLSCNYTSSNPGDSIHWYRQYPSSKPEFLILISKFKEREEKDGFIVKLEKANNLVHLELSSAEVTDSALYYCALQPTVTGNPFTLHKNVTLQEPFGTVRSKVHASLP
ncbi:hypothetical protein SKAU_G00200950 [Synaphobranchus kaupii]|uniref:Ig-like domain-containing protein n=1 Tax=Synaphobranchus kaupii TaxID=118154 RepID=A0A9Q1FFD0_SYNKA|nr:hypothetical protein SKAU_G00200950 [Synaphobranchus kaupii]